MEKGPSLVYSIHRKYYIMFNKVGFNLKGQIQSVYEKPFACEHETRSPCVTPFTIDFKDKFGGFLVLYHIFFNFKVIDGR